LLFLVFVFIASALIAGYLKWLSHIQAPYQWSREGSTYTNPFYGLQITKREGWLRYTASDSLGKRIFLSQVSGRPVPFLFPKRNLIEFRRFGKREQPDAVVSIGPVDNLEGKPYGKSLRAYARVSLESLMTTKIWLKQGQIELTEISGESCAKVKVSTEIPKLGDVDGEYCLFIKGNKGFHIAYNAIPSEYDQYRDEAMSIIQSFRFLDRTKEGVKS